MVLLCAENQHRPASSSGTSGSGSGGAFANINLVPTSGNPLSSQSVSSKPMVKTGSLGPKSESAILTEKFRDFIKTADLRKDYELPAVRYLTTMNSLLAQKSATKDTTSTVVPSTTETTNVDQSGNEKAKSLFAPAPAPVAFSFGSTMQNSTKAPAATTPTFSFGATSSSATGGAPASGVSSGFNFAPAPMAAAPIPGTNVKIALSPVPAPSLTVTKPPTTTTNSNNDGDEDDEALPPEEKTELASADDDWDSLLTVKVRAYNYRNDNVARKFAGGALKVQQHKESKKRRMVLRDGAGKVWVNIGIFRGMNFTKNQPPAKPGSRPVGNITFVGVNDKDRGGEMFTFVCGLDDLDPFHKILEESSS